MIKSEGVIADLCKEKEHVSTRVGRMMHSQQCGNCRRKEVGVVKEGEGGQMLLAGDLT